MSTYMSSLSISVPIFSRIHTICRREDKQLVLCLYDPSCEKSDKYFEKASSLFRRTVCVCAERATHTEIGDVILRLRSNHDALPCLCSALSLLHSYLTSFFDLHHLSRFPRHRQVRHLSWPRSRQRQPTPLRLQRRKMLPRHASRLLPWASLTLAVNVS